MKLDVITLDGKKSGDVDLDDAVFGLEPRADILQRVVRWQLAKRQAGTHKTKGRAEIWSTGAKMYRQKGTGRARHGSKRVPQFRGGGRAFGPVVRSHAHDLPKKVRALGLRHALSSKAKAGGLIVVDALKFEEAKTKVLKERFGKLGFASVLIVDGAEIDNGFRLASRNIPHVDVLPIQGINVYDILRRDTLVLTRAAIDALGERFGAAADGEGEKPAKKAAAAKKPAAKKETEAKAAAKKAPAKAKKTSGAEAEAGSDTK